MLREQNREIEDGSSQHTDFPFFDAEGPWRNLDEDFFGMEGDTTVQLPRPPKRDEDTVHLPRPPKRDEDTVQLPRPPKRDEHTVQLPRPPKRLADSSDQLPTSTETAGEAGI